MPDERRQLNSGVLAPLAAQFGDPELAIEMLSEVDESTLLPIVSLPFFSEVRASTQFRELIDARGFVSFWRETGQWPDMCRPLGLDQFECF